jgi:hypothetical protein
MIRLIDQGKYNLFETFEHTKILNVGDQHFAWINAGGDIGDILVATKRDFNPSATISRGTYRLYDIKGEPKLTDLLHLELFIGDGKWQGYLLPKGLPNGVKRHKIIATSEIITKTTH